MSRICKAVDQQIDAQAVTVWDEKSSRNVCGLCGSADIEAGYGLAGGGGCGVGREDIKAKMIGAPPNPILWRNLAPPECFINDPSKPEYQRLRKTAFKVLRDATGEDLGKPENTV